jgi:uroporphyrinogen decarboxylase
MDIAAAKRQFGDRLCILGNVDLNILGMGTPKEVEDEVRYLIDNVGPGGGYIISSGNSLAAYVLPENANAMAAAVRSYGRY